MTLIGSSTDSSAKKRVSDSEDVPTETSQIEMQSNRTSKTEPNIQKLWDNFKSCGMHTLQCGQISEGRCWVKEVRPQKGIYHVIPFIEHSRRHSNSVMTESQLVFPGDKGQEGKGYQRQEEAFGVSGFVCWLGWWFHGYIQMPKPNKLYILHMYSLRASEWDRPELKSCLFPFYIYSI